MTSPFGRRNVGCFIFDWLLNTFSGYYEYDFDDGGRGEQGSQATVDGEEAELDTGEGEPKTGEEPLIPIRRIRQQFPEFWVWVETRSGYDIRKTVKLMQHI